MEKIENNESNLIFIFYVLIIVLNGLRSQHTLVKTIKQIISSICKLIVDYNQGLDVFVVIRHSSIKLSLLNFIYFHSLFS